MDFLPTTVKSHPRPASSKHTPESRHWRQYKHPVFIKEYAPVTSVHFSSAKPHRYAVTAATRVQIYAPRTQKITKTISRFKDVARSGNIREDGKLVVAGDDSGLVQVFDINSRAILRTLDSHKQPVHVSKFSTLSPTQILTCSDDTTAKVWDVPSQTSICTFLDHTDYVRTGQFSTSNPNIVLTGSYDATVRLFDSRTGECEMVMGGNLPGATPVEQVLMFPSGTAAISSAGPIIRVWDIVAGGRCLKAISNHQKTVTALTFNADASRLLTGGLDHMVKVYDVSTYKVVHTMRYPAPILCLAVSPDETHIVGGMSDGTLSVRRRQTRSSELQPGLLGSASLFGEQLAGVGQGHVKDKAKAKRLGDPNELMVERRRRKRLRDYDRLLKAFKYSAALDAVLRKNVPPATTFSLIQELIHRDGLKIALAGRDDVLLEPILRLLLKHVTDPRFGELVCDVARVVIDMYQAVIGQAPLMDSLFVRLHKKVMAELRFQAELQRAKGALMMVMSSSLASLPP
ncbi:Trp-Asp repeat-containing protein [Macrolepiota fuliginosa MF-IS2]|uniref:Trp-Asp repeat-containing protein n=1 Tax=Macrolepiota fuliginosa MF-IS2 TaxID=1400762 RepID=A0A9P5XMA1_9AGAR|nr:Trp-Asp repeat-containing protein [Macrolepiota fuliginosa MF-IS2]